MEERLQKLLSARGVGSRRAMEEWITDGRVTVNGQVARLGDKADPERDEICVDGVPLRPEGERVYLMLHKPRGYVTTLSDERGRKTVAQLVADCGRRVWPVGRLDLDSEGLLIMTNDGAFANAMMHPSKHVPKTYRVTVRPEPTAEQIDILATGVELDGRLTAPADVFVVSKEEGRAVLEIVLREGRNRQIRRMCESQNLEVARLRRIAVGPIKLGMLQTGQWRDLTPAEVESLFKAAGMKTGGGSK